MKRLKISIGLLVVFVVGLNLATMNTYTNAERVILTTFTKAFANGNETNTKKCNKPEKDSCKFKVKTSAQIPLIKEFFPDFEVKVGIEIDFTDATQLFPAGSGYTCGEDVTCNKLLTKLGLI